jgi:phosphatidylglycerophosphatase B
MVILMGIVFLTPLPFTACSPNSWWCTIAYAFTSSGGPTGFFVALIITSLFYASSTEGLKKKVWVFFKSAIVLIAVFGILAFINERYTKPLLKSQRPSHVYMLEQTGSSSTIDSLYLLDKKARRQFFSDLMKNYPVEFRKVDPAIQAHWVEEAGYSFPSGHTFNAFLFTMIIAYSILFNRSFPRLRKFFALPFVWALLVGVSRVAMGAHTAVDVSAGAALGISLGLLFLYIDHTRIWLTRK